MRITLLYLIVNCCVVSITKGREIWKRSGNVDPIIRQKPEYAGASDHTRSRFRKGCCRLWLPPRSAGARRHRRRRWRASWLIGGLRAGSPLPNLNRVASRRVRLLNCCLRPWQLLVPTAHVFPPEIVTSLVSEVTSSIILNVSGRLLRDSPESGVESTAASRV
jgi:hypothetical protein